MGRGRERERERERQRQTDKQRGRKPNLYVSISSHLGSQSDVDMHHRPNSDMNSPCLTNLEADPAKAGLRLHSELWFWVSGSNSVISGLKGARVRLEDRERELFSLWCGSAYSGPFHAQHSASATVNEASKQVYWQLKECKKMFIEASAGCTPCKHLTVQAS